MKKLLFLLILALAVRSEAASGTSPPAGYLWAWNPGCTPSNYVTKVNAVTQYGFVGDGVTDNWPMWTNMLGAVSTMTDIIIPGGLYKTSKSFEWGSSGTFPTYYNKKLYIRGDGPGVTQIRCDDTASLKNGFYCRGASTQADLLFAATANEGDTNIVLFATTALAVGDFVMVAQTNDTAYVLGNSDDASCNPTWNPTNSTSSHFGQGEFNRVFAISGTNVTLSFPLHWTLTNGFIRETTLMEGCGITDLSIWNTNRQSNAGDIGAFRTAFFYVSNVWSSNFWNRGIYLEASLRPVVRRSLIGQADNPASAVYGIQVFENTTDAWVVDNILGYELGGTASSAIIIQDGAVGNVIEYNAVLSTWPFSWAGQQCLAAGINFHGYWPAKNLIQGNLAGLGYSDLVWGGSDLNVYHRNWFTRQDPALAAIDQMSNCVAGIKIRKRQYRTTLTGNVIGVPWEVGSGKDSLEFGLDCAGNGNDTQVTNSAFVALNVFYENNTTNSLNGATYPAIPNDMVRNVKPDFFGDLVWPPYGVGTPNGILTNDIPALVRYRDHREWPYSITTPPVVPPVVGGASIFLPLVFGLED